LLTDAADIHFFGGADCIIQRVRHPSLERGIQISQPEHFIGGLAENISRPIETDGAFRQGAGLIGAENVHAAEVFDRGQAADDDPFLRHGAGTFRKCDADDCRQKLRRDPNRKCDREQQSFDRRPVHDDVDGEYDQGENEHDFSQQITESPYPAFKFRFRRAQSQFIGYLSEFGVCSRFHHQHRGASALYARSRIDTVGPFFQAGIFPDIGRCLFGRLGFTRENGLVDE